MKALFDELNSGRLEKAISVAKERGEQYGDTLRNSQWVVTRAVAKKLGIELTKEQARAIAIAGLCDIKHDRFEGGYKEDHIDDGINYLSVLPGLVDLAISRTYLRRIELPPDIVRTDGAEPIKWIIPSADDIAEYEDPLIYRSEDWEHCIFAYGSHYRRSTRPLFSPGEDRVFATLEEAKTVGL